MKFSEALRIVDNIESENYTDIEKLAAVDEMLDAGFEPNSVTKKGLMAVIRYLYNKTEITPKELLAIKAVNYGCNTNKKCAASTYITNVHDLNKTEEISFCEAIRTVFRLIDRLEGEMKNV